MYKFLIKHASKAKQVQEFNVISFSNIYIFMSVHLQFWPHTRLAWFKYVSNLIKYIVLKVRPVRKAPTLCGSALVPFNPFVPSAVFLCTLKTLENRTIFWCFQGVEKGCIGNELEFYCKIINILFLVILINI